MTPSYLRGARAALLAYDVTSSVSFSNLDSWMSSLRDGAPEHATVALVGCKSDLVGRRAVDPECALAYPVVIINWVHYLGPPVPSTSQILVTFSRFSEDFLGRERGGGP